MGRKAYKLTPDMVKEIRENRNGLTYQKQADKYGVHKNTIIKVRYHILHRDVV